MKRIVFTLLLTFIYISNSLVMEDIAKMLSQNIGGAKYSVQTINQFNMDCLKVLTYSENQTIGIFHSSKGTTDSYNRLYSAIMINNSWNLISKLSDRGSQGSLFIIPNSKAILVSYELENHEHGNTIALRYYENYQKLKIQNFLYEYQIIQKIDNQVVRNIGTPSFDSIKLINKQSNQSFNQFQLKIKFHYSPDGSHDLPGYGTIMLRPLRDFVDKNKNWIGGCKQNYTDWIGKSDVNVSNAIKRLGISGKIGQRDSFTIYQKGIQKMYYIYECNLYSDFNWKNWRIVLYSQSENRALPIPFQFDKVIDIANPHISLQKYESGINRYTFWVSFFLPSQGMQPLSDVTPGQMLANTFVQF